MAQPMEFTQASMIPGPGIVSRERLDEGRRFVVLTYGRAPYVMPYDEPGTYEVDAAALSDGARWPMAVLTIPAEHTTMFERLSVERSDAWLDGMVAQMKRQANA